MILFKGMFTYAMECYYVKNDKPKIVKQLKDKESQPRDYPLEPIPDSLESKKQGEFNWGISIWIAIILVIGSGLMHWAIKISSNHTATVKPDSIETPMGYT